MRLKTSWADRTQVNTVPDRWYYYNDMSRWTYGRYFSLAVLLRKKTKFPLQQNRFDFTRRPTQHCRHDNDRLRDTSTSSALSLVPVHVLEIDHLLLSDHAFEWMEDLMDKILWNVLSTHVRRPDLSSDTFRAAKWKRI